MYFYFRSRRVEFSVDTEGQPTLDRVSVGHTGQELHSELERTFFILLSCLREGI